MKNKFLIFLLTLSFLACGKKESNNKNENVKPVVYEIVGSKENSVKRTYSGTIKSEALSNLSFRVSGTINKRIADLGDTVKKGEILATLDNTEYMLNYEKALADLAKGQASFAETEANYKRSQILYLENSISKASYDSAIAQYKSAFSTVNALKEAL
ncbi:efflux RND transporter periplasmic adaptor subunit, partial [Cetobacterium sp.]